MRILKLNIELELADKSFGNEEYTDSELKQEISKAISEIPMMEVLSFQCEIWYCIRKKEQ